MAIPLGVIDIMVHFFYICDSWNTNYNQNNIKITNEYFMENTSPNHATAYGNIVVMKGTIYSWKIRLISYKKTSGNTHHPYIGIIKDEPQILNENTGKGYNFRESGYVFCCGRETVLRPSNKRYGN
eukprot:412011_1